MVQKQLPYQRQEKDCERESSQLSLSRVFVVKRQRSLVSGRNTILIDDGDFMQGTIMTDDLFNKYPEKEHPVISTMNLMGYDAITLGNHEFNWGVPAMQTIVGRAEAPVLAANVKDANGEMEIPYYESLRLE